MIYGEFLILRTWTNPIVILKLPGNRDIIIQDVRSVEDSLEPLYEGELKLSKLNPE